MKFLLYGNGWISLQIQDYLREKNYDFVLGKCRVNNIDELRKELVSSQATHVLCLIGRTHGKIGDKEYTTIDYLEQPGKLVENIRDNLFSPVALAILCNEYGIHCNVCNTGCIFNYDSTHTEEIGFTEKDEPNFFDSSYSIVKGFTDSILKLLPNVCISRIRMPISSKPDPRNFITKITTYDKICSMPNSMTVLDDLIPVFVSLSERKFCGAINLTNVGVITHDRILTLYREIVDPNFTWKNFSYEEQIKILAAGRSNNYLNTTLLESMFDVPNIEDSIRNVLIRMKEHIEYERNELNPNEGY